MNASRWPTLLLLLVAAVASGVLVLRNDEKVSDRVTKPELGIGYYMKQAELVRIDENGRVLYRVQTDEATQRTRDGIIELDLVLVSYDPLTEVPWDLRADKGQILPDRNIIQLSGDVIAKTRGEIQAPIRISTDYLELDTDTYTADTDREVTIDYTNNKIFATGLRAFLKEERLQLVSNVNGKFIP
jgi:lipopolysaccharide export system protein LptC